MIGTILLVVLILLLLGAFPSWPHSRSWGYGPSGILGVVVIIVIVLLLMGRIYGYKSTGVSRLPVCLLVRR
jgi:Protein of unknown function (DUF3309)